ncbi:MAG: chemotaxis-specific protein-glutamate methyltransferase CheB [Candidatus Latescibacteria bacterium]|nr:chemotaxis-specific protein-glutamate methyltransferase CheB [bacterium]MBD3423767.1 chemotaxis-specific protein-glutamate methyltransferase CheB [Candidatus Latescibacterota bacterium]
MIAEKRNKIRVLVAEDSRFMSKMIADILSGDPGIEVAGIAYDGTEVLKKVSELRPDCITLDLEMPRMDGLETLRYLMSEWPTPVVVLSACGEKAALKALTCLDYGAVDFVAKSRSGMNFQAEELICKIKIAAGVNVSKMRFAPPHYRFNTRRGSVNPDSLEAVVLIGASTGGPNVLMEIIPALPAELPAGVIVVQHMPAEFTRYLAERLDGRSKIDVSEAEDGDNIEPGRVLISPGGGHLIYEKRGRVPSVAILPRNSSQRTACPSIDFALTSLAPVFRERMISVILTGMGRDGLSGCNVLHGFGGRVIAQSPDSCIVSGIPGSIIEKKLADRVAGPPEIAGIIEEEVSRIESKEKVHGR